MVPCSKCRFSSETGVASWPVDCHRHAPTPLAEDAVACWPAVRPKAAAIGCGDGEVKIEAAGVEGNTLFRAELQRVRDWLKFAANSEGGIVAEIDEVLRIHTRCEAEAAEAAGGDDAIKTEKAHGESTV